MAEINFKEKWGKLSWIERAEITRVRADVFRCIHWINYYYGALQLCKKHKKSAKFERKKLRELINDLADLEFELQRLWGVKEDANYHTYWMLPDACTCPKLDNMDQLGFGRIISGDCPLHGEHPCWKTKGK